MKTNKEVANEYAEIFYGSNEVYNWQESKDLAIVSAEFILNLLSDSHDKAEVKKIIEEIKQL